MLDRYKKKGGFVQLLMLVETSSKQKQDHFLELIASESIVWKEMLSAKMLNMEKILAWPPPILAEVFTRVQPLTLAVAFHGLSNEQFEKNFSSLSLVEKRRLTQLMGELNPTTAEKSSCLIKLIGEVRALANQNIIKFEKFDNKLVIDENIEELIQNQKGNNTTDNDSFGSTIVTELADVDIAKTGSGLSFDLKRDQKEDNSIREERDLLKKKMALLVNELNTLKNENQLLKGKLEQIKKIA